MHQLPVANAHVDPVAALHARMNGTGAGTWPRPDLLKEVKVIQSYNAPRHGCFELGTLQTGEIREEIRRRNSRDAANPR